MSRLISFVLPGSSWKPSEGSENYKMKNSWPLRDLSSEPHEVAFYEWGSSWTAGSHEHSTDVLETDMMLKMCITLIFPGTTHLFWLAMYRLSCCQKHLLDVYERILLLSSLSIFQNSKLFVEKNISKVLQTLNKSKIRVVSSIWWKSQMQWETLRLVA